MLLSTLRHNAVLVTGFESRPEFFKKSDKIPLYNLRFRLLLNTASGNSQVNSYLTQKGYNILAFYRDVLNWKMGSVFKHPECQLL